MDPFSMVVGIVLIVTVGGVLRARYKGGANQLRLSDDPDAIRMRDEIKTLKERVVVLERIATDKNQLLEQEFERLRDQR